MSARWTPFEINVLLHHFTSPEPYEPDSELYRSVVRQYQELNILDSAGSVTPYGAAFVVMILSVKPPQVRYFDERGQEVLNEHHTEAPANEHP